MEDPSNNSLPNANRRRILKGAMILSATPYAVAHTSQPANAHEELFDRLENQLGHFDDLLATADDAVLIDYRREQLDTLEDEIKAADLPRGQERRLQSTISAAHDSNDRAGEYAVKGDEDDSEEEQDATDGQLNAFINSVEAQQGKQIDESTGDELIDIATQALEARDDPLVRADDIQDRDAPTSSAFEAHVEESFDDLQETVSGLEDEGYDVTLDYFHEDGPGIDANPLFTISVGALGFAALGTVKTATGIIGLKTLGAVGIATMGGWIAAKHTTARELVQQFYANTPNFRIAAARYLLRKNYEQNLGELEERTEGDDSVLENAIEEFASRAIGDLVPRISDNEAAVLVEYISQVLKSLGEDEDDEETDPEDEDEQEEEPEPEDEDTKTVWVPDPDSDSCSRITVPEDAYPDPAFKTEEACLEYDGGFGE